MAVFSCHTPQRIHGHTHVAGEAPPRSAAAGRRVARDRRGRARSVLHPVQYSLESVDCSESYGANTAPSRNNSSAELLAGDLVWASLFGRLLL